jgi:hypothetical protein
VSDTVWVPTARGGLWALIKLPVNGANKHASIATSNLLFLRCTCILNKVSYL